MAKKSICFIVTFRFTLFRNKHWPGCLNCFILFQSFSYISFSFHLLRNRNGFIKKYICFIVSYCFALFRNKHWQWFLVCYILFQSFLYISWSFHLLRNRNGLKNIFLGLEKYLCFIVSFCFTLFRNKLWTSLLVCYILFQRLSSISYSFHLLRNRNGSIKKKRCMFHCFISFHPVS